MALIVQKYGGTSVGSVERIREVAKRVAAYQRQGHRIVVVVSAMAGETNRLLDLARQVARRPSERESDALVASGEQVSAALLALALQDLGLKAASFLGHQVRIATDSAFGRARIQSIDKHRLLATLADGTVAVVAGFQGVDRDNNITTLGRGGSDTTGVALAAALGADVCEIFTDVDGVYTGDPRIVPHARKLGRVSYDEMLELASLGAKVLQIRAVEFAKRYRVPVHVRSSFGDEPGTMVIEEDKPMENVLVSGVAHDRDQAKITLLRVPDRPGLAAKVFGPIAAAGIVVDMIIQNASADGITDLTFTVPRGDFQKALSMVRGDEGGLGVQGIATDTKVAKVSIVGLGMRSHAGVAARMFEVLAGEGINIQMISTSEIKISVVVDEKYTELAVRALHDAFIPSRPAESRRPSAQESR
ncbi:MAG: aspartate kinase [Deltaproteobacteria bacterium]|nr:aspartate kinase [Deltaproteobacteria bacterium]